MVQSIRNIENILKEITVLYEKVYEDEILKQDAIISRDGKELEHIAVRQELVAREIERLESARNDNVADFIKNFRLDVVAGQVTLKDIVRCMDEDSSHRLLRLGMELKDLMLRLQKLQKNNAALVGDSMQFYTLLLDGLKESAAVKTGYDRRGEEKSKVTGSLLINKTA
jgi:flagellar biosynthesis/type III secretory pathway chaperone